VWLCTFKKRFFKTMEILANNPGESILSACGNRNDAKAIYRMLNNENFDEDEIFEAHRKATIARIEKQQVILAVQDTTGINYANHLKTEAMGYNCEQTLGVNLHSCLAVRPDGLVLGLLAQSCVSRQERKIKIGETQKKARPIEEKESYRWLETMEKSSVGISDCVKLIHVCDREGDIYELYAKALQTGQNFLIRIMHNRNTVDTIKLMEQIRGLKPQGSVLVEIPRDSRRNIPERELELSVSYQKICVKKPKSSSKDLPENLPINIISIRSQEKDGLEPIEWLLATNEEINSVEKAFEYVGYYVQRWKIERFHHVLKSGCKVELIQERTLQKTETMLMLKSIIAVKIMNVTFLARLNGETLCDCVLDEAEWKLLYCAANKTNIPPQRPYSIEKAILYLSQLGGYKRCKSDGPPGLKTVWKGIAKLYLLLSFADCFPVVGQV